MSQKRAQWLLFVVLVVVMGAFARCGTKQGSNQGSDFDFPAYKPGAALTATAYLDMKKGLDETFSLEKFMAFNRAVELELTPAMYHVFANPKSFVTYGNNGQTQDGRKAFRAVWRLHDPSTNLYVAVMTFWTYSKTKEKFALAGGADAIRVRTQIGKVEDYARSGWLSYTVTMAGEEVASISPGDYLLADGKMKADVVPEASPTRCDGCHYHGSIPSTRLVEESPVTTAMDWEMQFAPEEFPASRQSLVRTQLATPKTTFFPKGIIEALKKRGSTLGLK